MKNSVDRNIGQKFAAAASVLMTRVFSTPLEPNHRRLAFAFGPASRHANFKTEGNTRFDVLGMGFKPGREWKGPKEIFLEEMRTRDGEVRIWRNCQLWADVLMGPLYLLTEDPDVCFSFDGNALVPLTGDVDDRQPGIQRAKERLRSAARLVPDDLEQQTMM